MYYYVDSGVEIAYQILNTFRWRTIISSNEALDAVKKIATGTKDDTTDTNGLEAFAREYVKKILSKDLISILWIDEYEDDIFSIPLKMELNSIIFIYIIPLKEEMLGLYQIRIAVNQNLTTINYDTFVRIH